MGFGEDYYNYKYSPHLIYQYYLTIPIWRKIIMRLFPQYRISKKEYDVWFCNKIIS